MDLSILNIDSVKQIKHFIDTINEMCIDTSLS